MNNKVKCFKSTSVKYITWLFWVRAFKLSDGDYDDGFVFSFRLTKVIKGVHLEVIRSGLDIPVYL